MICCHESKKNDVRDFVCLPSVRHISLRSLHWLLVPICFKKFQILRQ
jgi:hypothetical protein